MKNKLIEYMANNGWMLEKHVEHMGILMFRHELRSQQRIYINIKKNLVDCESRHGDSVISLNISIEFISGIWNIIRKDKHEETK